MIGLITRSDDAGSGKGANLGIFAAADGGFVKNISFMAPGPQIEEAAQVLRGRKDVCFGMHFTMNAEWDRVKWGPVSSVPSLVDSDGHFFPDPVTTLKNGGIIEDIHKEWCAQLDRLTRLGLDIRYADTHMFPECAFEGLADLMSGWIKEKGLVDHRYFYNVLPRIDDVAKNPGLFEEVVRELPSGEYFSLTHPAESVEDMYLTGNAAVKTEDIVRDRKQDMLFAMGTEALPVCEKYGIVTLRYDEATLDEVNRDSALQWLNK